MSLSEWENLKRCLQKSVMSYLLLHPAEISKPENQKVFDDQRERRIRVAMSETPGTKYEDAAPVIDLMYQHEAQKFPNDFLFSQEEINCFLPDARWNEESERHLRNAFERYLIRGRETK